MLSAMRRLPPAAVSLCIATAAAASPAPIIGGTPATLGQYPTVVALTVGNGICTGTLIHREWVLTAAHCITPSVVQLPSQEAVTQDLRIHFGTVDLTRSPGDVRTASLTIPKPGFSIGSLGQNDIGLIRLSQPVSGIAPTPVNLDPARAPVGTVVTMVGFGATEQSGTGTVGVELVLEDRTSTSCAPYGMSDVNLLCFSQLDGKGKCRGDSGGPSFAQLDGRPTVVGVTSFGDPECAQLGADTRTDVEREFIERHVPALASCDGDEDCPDRICFDGRCIAAPFSDRGIGTACTTGADCESGVCGEGSGGKRCTELCATDASESCPDGFDCVASSGAAGACWPDEGGGCCDASGRGAPTMLLGIALVGLVLRGRRGAPATARAGAARR
jgi:hypothetical protein